VLKNGLLVPKETMAITMIDPFNVKNTSFEESHLLAKLQKMLICTRMFQNKNEDSAIFLNVMQIDLNDKIIYEQIKADYELIRNVIINQGFENLSGKLGVYIQPRTKGAGHGSKSRAFYARTSLLKLILRPPSHQPIKNFH
jgi:DNA mismatch repair protein MutH